MRLTIDRDALHTALSTVSRATSTRSTMPALAGVLLRAGDDLLSLTGTDLEISIEAVVPADVEVKGAVILPAKMFLELVRKLGEGSVRIDVDENHRATIEWRRSRLKLHGMAPRVFPGVQNPKGNETKFDPDTLREVLRRVTWCVSTDETRPILTGVCVDMDGNRIRALATDGFRVAVFEDEVQWKVGAGPVQGIVIPGRALKELERLLDTDEECWMYVDEGSIRWELGDITLTSRLIEGQYPNVLDLIPTDFPVQVRTSRRELLSALERAALLSDSRFDSRWLVRLTVQPGCVVVTASDPEMGEAREEVPAEVAGDGLEIGFNARYLIEGLKAIGADEIEFGLIDPLKAGRIRGVGERGFAYWVLPVKLKDEPKVEAPSKNEAEVPF